MSFDLFQSRANYNEFCKWWTKDKNAKHTSDKMIMKRIPSGTFMAMEITPENMQDTVIGDAFMIDRSNVTIKSPDDLSSIKSEDLVLYQGELWIVENVQKSKAKIQNTFFANDKNCSHYWYLELQH